MQHARCNVAALNYQRDARTYEFASDQMGLGPHQSLPERAIAVAGLLPVVGWLGRGIELGADVARGLVAAADVARTGAEADDYLHFVHGTTTALWDTSQGIRAGSGELGAGFYTFEDTAWGREAATDWALRKAADDGSIPIFVRAKMQRTVFESLTRQDIAPDALDTAYQLLHNNNLADVELLVSNVGRRGADGLRVANFSLPLQYKFEGVGIAKLEVNGIIPVG